MKRVKEKSFGGENSEAYNALMQAIKDCGHDDAESKGLEHNDYNHYKFLEETPIATLTVKIVDKLNEYGLTIKKK